MQMAFGRKTKAQLIAVDLGARTTKAVLLERRGDRIALLRYGLFDAPISDKKVSPELLAEHLRGVAAGLDASTKSVALAIGLDDVVVRQVELPPIPVNEMRMVLRNNTKGYLQQDLPGHVFDCHMFPPRAAAGKPADGARPSGIAKLKVLVAAARQQMVNDYQLAARSAGLSAESVVPGLIAPVNAFELAMPMLYEKESVALVDIGFKHSSVCVVDRGELTLTRVVNIGGDKMTAGLAESMNITYAEAEGIKVGMGQEVQASLENLVLPLGRELRASLDFFEHQYDRPVSQVFLTGGSAKSELMLEILKSELVVDCKTWSPVGALDLALPGQQAVEVEHIGSQLAVAVG
ncbi:MAG TPA: pilus assembly protein PilM, partial [Verrucomicrobiae bacterium]|nr:pilus assembly protein PilM [Verrucomicrobiae bacterium]